MVELKMKNMKLLVAWLILAIAGTSLYAQSVTFRVEELTIAPSAVTGDSCVQVGIFMDYTGPTSTWGHFEASLDFAYPAGFLSATTGFVDLSDFSVPGDPGIASPGLVLSNSSASTTPCAIADIFNSATLGGVAVPFMTGAGGAPAVVTEAYVDGGAGTGTIDLTSLSFGSLFTTEDGQSYLMAIIEFPLAGPGTNGQIDVTFRNAGPADNFITDGVTTVNPGLFLDGYVQVFDTVACGDGTNYADFTDSVGSGTASTQNGDDSIGLDYLDPALGGVGGEMEATINYGANVVGYQITGDDGYDSGVVAVAGPGSSNETINPSSANATTIYDITFFVLGLDGVTLVPGTACQLTATWNDAACTLTWQNNGIGGANSVLTATITNALPTALVYGQVDVPNGAAGLADPIDIVAGDLTGTAGGTATFVIIDQSIPDGTWAGDYTLSSFGSPSGVTPTDCVAPLGFVCPSNVTITSITNPVTIGGAITVEFSGDDVTNGFDVIYNGTTTSNATSPFALPNTADGSVLTVEVVGNGFGPDGSPCTDSDTITLTFEAASCGVVTLDPPPPVDGYAVGDTITTMEIEVTGASSVTIDGVACTPSLDPDTNATVTWTYPNPYNVMGPASLAVIATNPNGTVTNCDDIVIDVDCAEANIVGIPSANTTGDIVVEGIPGLTYTVMYSPVCGQVQFDIIVDAQPAAVPADVTIGANGFGYLSNVTVVPDVCYYLVCPGDVIASSLRVMTVPTMGEWATIAFIMLVMVAGLVVLRKKN